MATGGEIMDRGMFILALSGVGLAFRYLEGRARARKKLRQTQVQTV